MAIAALVLSLLALLLILAARLRLASLSAEVEELGRRVRRDLANWTEEQVAILRTLRQQLAVVAGGGELDPDQILEGRLWRDVDAPAARELLESGSELRILDVRTPAETAGGVLPGAELVPLDQLEQRAEELARDPRPTLVYCSGGSRSAAACELLSQAGHASLMNLAGGLASWTGPTARP